MTMNPQKETNSKHRFNPKHIRFQAEGQKLSKARSSLLEKTRLCNQASDKKKLLFLKAGTKALLKKFKQTQ